MAALDLQDMIPLADILATLRTELDIAGRQGGQSDTKFRFNEVELELQVVTEKGAKGGGGVKFWVYNASGEVNANQANTQRLTLKFTPVSAQSGDNLLVSDDDEK